MALIKNLRRRVLLNKQLEQLKKDRVILLICLGVALSLWIPAKMSQVYRMEKKVRLEFQLPPGHTFLKPPPEDIEVLLEGRGWSLLFDALFSKEILLRFTIKNSTAFDLNPGRLRAAIFEKLHASNLTIIEVNYDELHLVTEPMHRKKVAVQFAGNIGFVPEYYLKDEIQLNPREVVIKGPASVLRRLEQISTDSILLNNLSNDFRGEVDLRPAPGLVTEPKRVELTIFVEQYTEKQLFVPIRPASGANDARFFPAQVRISFRVGLSRFNQVRSSDFEVVAEMPQNTGSDGEKARLLITKMPPLLRSVRMTPEHVDYLFFDKNG